MSRLNRPPRIQNRDLHGILLLDKPLGLSSNQALQAVRRLLCAAKGGHTGALDPLATGLLPLCFGEATKLAGSLLGSRKAYVAECQLGVTTDTADKEGEVLLSRPVPALDEAVIEKALAKRRGRILQVPPVYSALKQDGERLYVKARRGEAVDVPPREVDVYRLDLLSRTADTLTLHIECGSGTYVRSLAVDIGEDLGCGAHVTVLRRLWVEPFREPQMVTIEALQLAAEQGDEELLKWLLPVSAGLSDLPVAHLDDAQSMAISRGQKIQLNPAPPVGQCAAYASDGALLALLEVDIDGFTRIVRGFNLPPG
ncbi:tRNA pseudouridine(55) synthase TruB [Rhodanobacter sp. MP1X3]|uniref:tRNA pseudouridine(55) synthase TruB n=1 Tax=Rhodanobacter sp. MP1X3 TaxID=2723086 RepID=UPI0016077DBC|nr:tRNA pseudouridine(55) synthase TruB [Rhodanobacter sp. MP1X3]